MFKQLYGAEMGLDMLRLYKRVFDFKKVNIGTMLEYDYEYESCFDAINALADNVEMYFLEDFPDNSMYKITFDEMPEFFRLCKLYARNHGVAFKNTAFYKGLFDYISNRIFEANPRGISWNLVAPKKIVKKKTYHLYVETCGEYLYSYTELAIALYDIGEYIQEKTDELLGIVSQELKIKRFKKPQETRKKAA